MATIEQAKNAIKEIQKAQKYLYLSFGVGDPLYRIEASSNLSFQETSLCLAFMLCRLIADDCPPSPSCTVEEWISDRPPSSASWIVEDFKKSCLEELSAIRHADIFDKYTLSACAYPDEISDNPFLENVSKKIESKVANEKFVFIGFSSDENLEKPDCKVVSFRDWSFEIILLLIMRATLDHCIKLAHEEYGHNLNDWNHFLDLFGQMVLGLYERRNEIVFSQLADATEEPTKPKQSDIMADEQKIREDVSF